MGWGEGAALQPQAMKGEVGELGGSRETETDQDSPIHWETQRGLMSEGGEREQE